MDGGRSVAYSVAGPADGLPVVYLHGGIGTPIRCAPQLGEVVHRLGIRHVSINRPGFGGSCPAPGRRLLDFPEDLRRVLDDLGIGRFALVGISSGGPYALATARIMPERILSVGVVSCLSPQVAPHESSSMHPALRCALRAMLARPALAERVLTAALGLAARAPRAAMLLEGASGGVGGMIEDYALCCGRWGFDLGEVRPEVHLWHGAGDGFVPLAHARALARALPRCRPRIGTDDGHFFYRRRMAAVLEELVCIARARLAATAPAVPHHPTVPYRAGRHRLPAAA